MNLFDLKAAFQSGGLAKQKYIDEMHRPHRALFDYGAFMRDTDIAEIVITCEQVVMTTKASGIRLTCDPADARIVPIEILNFGTYEKNELDMIARLMENDFTVWDIGGNVGWHAINLAKSFPRARILAFEPIPSTFEQLKKNVALNGTSNVSLYNFGFSNKSEVLNFYFYPECSGNASSMNLSQKASVRTLRCPVKTIDEFAEEECLKVDFIKCDVEGAELFVFQGGLKTLGRDKPVIFAEMVRKWSAKFNYHPNRIIELLRDIGYHCFKIEENALAEFFAMDENTAETNFFFLHAVKHAALVEAMGRSGKEVKTA